MQEYNDQSRIVMAGLAKICKLYGSIKINGVTWIYDYDNDKPRLQTDMTEDEVKASEKAKWMQLKKN